MVPDNRGFLPTSKKEIDSLGWDYIDIILFTGDAYVDHPSFGTAVIGRYLESCGYRVAIVPQPNWRDDLRDFKKLGRPRLFFGVNAGVMDSMVNHYTAARRIRSNDAYTPEGKSGQRPDYAVTVYTKILKHLYPDVPVVIGGVEASLRRLAHYDYWQDKIKPSILIESGADLLVYGMGEQAIRDIAATIERGGSEYDLRNIPQVGYVSDTINTKNTNNKKLHSFDAVLKDKMLFVNNFNIIEKESNSFNPSHLIEQYDNTYVHINPPYPVQKDGDIDEFYDLPFTREPHFRYNGKHIPAFEMIKFSVNTHRGCFGSCSFCTISAHQGKFVVSRSEESILNELRILADKEGFKGNISDLGGPTANMYKMKGRVISLCEKCKRDSCIYPNICNNLDISHKPLLDLYSKAQKIKGIKRFFISSGIRYDLFLDGYGYLSKDGEEYLKELIVSHTSGRLKVAPEHTEEHVLKSMGKPSFEGFKFLSEEFKRINKIYDLKYQLIPYFISSHPGCNINDMKKLASNPYLAGIELEQVQDFTPTPMTRSSISFCTGIDPKTLKKIFVERDELMKKKQKSFFFNKL